MNYLAALLLLLCWFRPVSALSLSDLADSLLSQPQLRGSSWSIRFVSLTGDSVVFERDSGRMLIPASVAKLVTSAAAFEVLGSDFRFKTGGFSVSAPDAAGTLHGNVYVQGGADPLIDPRRLDSLGHPVLASLADSLWEHGIRLIEGDLVMRTWPYKLECAPDLWEVGDVNSNFAPTVDAFGYNSNVCRLAILPGATVELPPVVAVDPPYAPVSVRNEVATADASEEGWLDYHVVPGDTVVTIQGKIPLGDDGEYLWIPVQDPALYFGAAFRQQLDQRGIILRGQLRVDRSGEPLGDGRFPLFQYESDRLVAAASVMNKESDNFTAEYVQRAVAAASVGAANARAGADAVARVLRQWGINGNEIDLQDGCGLARQNLCCAGGLVKLLTLMHRHPAAADFIASLAVSGVSGTMAHRLASPEMVGKVHAKTGTITHVCSLAGYCVTQAGDTLAFAILCNNYHGSPHLPRAAQDRLIEAVCVPWPNPE
ncbi:D-alanyl-D-alanine carboxypeptidase/D-alanyl-D-alanine-endopeptidase [candidate division KSB1 bacterium]|nr:D-alanyl-D-alanine carboxypeptidase/D-alanyl-D-alanine-endopeptidase [candidate division KSB1 bacterium]